MVMFQALPDLPGPSLQPRDCSRPICHPGPAFWRGAVIRPCEPPFCTVIPLFTVTGFGRSPPFVCSHNPSGTAHRIRVQSPPLVQSSLLWNHPSSSSRNLFASPCAQACPGHCLHFNSPSAFSFSGSLLVSVVVFLRAVFFCACFPVSPEPPSVERGTDGDEHTNGA